MIDLLLAGLLCVVGSGVVFVDTFCIRWFPDTGEKFPDVPWKHRWFAIAKTAYRGTNLAGLPIIFVFKGPPALLSGRVVWCVLSAIELLWLLFVVTFPVLDHLLKQIAPMHRNSDPVLGSLVVAFMAIESLPAVVFIVVVTPYLIQLPWTGVPHIAFVDWMGLLAGCVWCTSFAVSLYRLRDGLRGM